jgi:hypothetical protein
MSRGPGALDAVDGTARAFEVVQVPTHVPLGDEEVGQRQADHLVAGPTEEQLGLAVPLGQDAFAVGLDEGIARQVEHVLHAPLEARGARVGGPYGGLALGDAYDPFSHRGSRRRPVVPVGTQG